MSEYLLRRLEALERQNSLLKAAIKETWTFVSYGLPLSVEIDVQEQPSLKAIRWNRKAFKPLLDLILNEALKILQETNAPTHYSVIVKAVENNQENQPLLERYSDPNLPGKVRDLAVEGYLTRVGKGMYFYGPKLAQIKKEVIA